MTRPALLLACLLLACDRGEDSDTPPCAREDDACCCPAPGTGIDCMPVIDACTAWQLETCDVECVTF
jgi:hypothetical protein